MKIPLLLADWIEGLIPLLVVAFWIVRAFLDAKGSAAEPEAVEVDWDELEADEAGDEFDPNDPNRWGEQAAQLNRQNAGRQNADRQKADRQKPVAAGIQAANQGGDPRSDVDDFLRRLEQQKEAENQQAAQGARRRNEQTQREKNRLRKQQLQEQRRKREQLASAGPPPNVQRGETVGEHVRQHMGHLKESTLAEQAAHLGEQVAQADDRVAARLHEKFDHQLGKLQARNTQRRSEAAAAAVLEPTSAESIAALLANPDSIRNAIVLNEILQRPTDRWD